MFKSFCLCLLSALTCLTTLAQETLSLDQMMTLNRSGKWEQAAQLAEKFLTEKQWKKSEDRCQAFYNLAYSQIRLGREPQAQNTLANYDKDCTDIAPTHWLFVEIKKLKYEISQPAQKSVSAEEDGFWQTGEPVSLRLSAPALEKHLILCKASGADACLVIKSSKIVQEFYSARYREPIGAMSSTKSIAGLLIGMLIDDGKIKSLDEPVCKYITEWCAGEKAKVTLHHLLSMTSGLPRIYENGVGSVGDKTKFVINFPLKFEPGSSWNYSNEGVQLLSPILDKAAGEPIQDYARRRLFEPLGMLNTRLHLDEKEHAWLYADMETTARDFARIGLLMLAQGKWKNKQIISEKWIKQSIEPSQKLNAGYGLLWWLYENPYHFAAKGYLNTDLYVFPQKDMVIVRMQSKPIGAELNYESHASQVFEELIEKP